MEVWLFVIICTNKLIIKYAHIVNYKAAEEAI